MGNGRRGERVTSEAEQGRSTPAADIPVSQDELVQAQSSAGNQAFSRLYSEGAADNNQNTSELSASTQHMFRQYSRLADNLTPEQWMLTLDAAEARAANQAGRAPMTEPASLSMTLPLWALLEPGARYVDEDAWAMIYNLFYTGDRSPAAGILIRNEIARRWFFVNGINPMNETVTLSLLDPDGTEPGPAQLDFRWRGVSVADSLGALELSWLDKALGESFKYSSAITVVSAEAGWIGEVAALERRKGQLQDKLPPLIERARANFKDAVLGEIEYYQHAVAADADRACWLEQVPPASLFAQGLCPIYSRYTSELFELAGQVRDWRLGKEVLGQKLDLDQGDVLELLKGESPYAQGAISYNTKKDLEEAQRDRMFITMLVTTALTFATFGVGAWVAEGVGLAEGTIAYGAVQAGTDYALTEVGTMATEHLVTSLKDFQDPTAQAIWRQGAHSFTDYIEAAGLGFAKGALLGGALTAGARGLRALSAWRSAGALPPPTAGLPAPAAGPLASEAVTEPPFTVLSDITNPLTNVRTWQLRTIDGELVTIAAHQETGSGYIWNAATGEMRQIINGELGGEVMMLGAGAQPERAGALMLFEPTPLQTGAEMGGALPLENAPGVLGPPAKPAKPPLAPNSPLMTDPEAMWALRDRYRAMSDSQLRTLANKGDAMAESVLSQRIPPNEANLARILGSEYRPPHQALVVARDAQGNISWSERLYSGNMTPAENALGFPQNMLATHTEARAVVQAPLVQGGTLRITGQYDPCRSCQQAMQQAANASGATIYYWWPGGQMIFRRGSPVQFLEH